TGENYYGLGNVYTEKYKTSKKAEDLKNAEQNLLQSLSIANELGAIESRMNAEKTLSDLYALSGDYKKAYEYEKSYAALKDSTTTEENTKKITQLQMEYEFEKKV